MEFSTHKLDVSGMPGSFADWSQPMDLSFPLIPTEGGREHGYKSVCDKYRSRPAATVSSSSKFCGKESPVKEGSETVNYFSQSTLPWSPCEMTQSCPLHDDSVLEICKESSHSKENGQTV